MYRCVVAVLIALMILGFYRNKLIFKMTDKFWFDSKIRFFCGKQTLLLLFDSSATFLR